MSVTMSPFQIISWLQSQLAAGALAFIINVAVTHDCVEIREDSVIFERLNFLLKISMALVMLSGGVQGSIS